MLDWLYKVTQVSDKHFAEVELISYDIPMLPHDRFLLSGCEIGCQLNCLKNNLNCVQRMYETPYHQRKKNSKDESKEVGNAELWDKFWSLEVAKTGRLRKWILASLDINWSDSIELKNYPWHFLHPPPHLSTPKQIPFQSEIVSRLSFPDSSPTKLKLASFLSIGLQY